MLFVVTIVLEYIEKLCMILVVVVFKRYCVY